GRTGAASGRGRGFRRKPEALAERQGGSRTPGSRAASSIEGRRHSPESDPVVGGDQRQTRRTLLPRGRARGSPEAEGPRQLIRPCRSQLSRKADLSAADFTTMNETHIGPVRITLRTFAPEEIRRQNDLVHDGTGGWEENVEGLILRIRASRHEGPLSSELLRNWAAHPDERVRIALLRSNPITRQTQSRTHAREIASLIVETDARFRTTDETWNPVLDVLACAREDLWCLDSLTGKPQNVRATDQPQPDSPLAWIRSRVVPKLHERGLSLN